MYITEGHFLSPFIVVLKDGKPVGMLKSVDTDLKVGIRVVGFDPEDGLMLTELIKIDEVVFITNRMPNNLRELIPAGFKVVDSIEEKGEV
jgi:hypothetical protein